MDLILWKFVFAVKHYLVLHFYHTMFNCLDALNDTDLFHSIYKNKLIWLAGVHKFGAVHDADKR